MFKGYLFISLGVWGVFRSFFKVLGMYLSFLDIGCVLDIFLCLRGHFGYFFDLWGYFGCIQVIEGVFVFFRHGGYLGYFRCFGGTLVSF